MQDGKYVDVEAGFPNAANVSQPIEPNGFTVFNHTDLQNNTDLYQTAEGKECTQPGSKCEKLVKDCKQDTPTGSQCCVKFKEEQAEVSLMLHIQSFTDLMSTILKCTFTLTLKCTITHPAVSLVPACALQEQSGCLLG